MTNYLPLGATKKSVLKNQILAGLTIVAGLSLAACDTGGQQPVRAAPTVPPPSPPPPPPPPPSGPVTISGAITFDRVPGNAATGGLVYANTTRAPARWVTVQAVDGSGAVIDTDVTDSAGNYSVSVQSNTSVRIQALAEMVQTTGATRNIQVRDNTSGDALYQLQGGLVSSGTANSTRSLNARSGWSGSSYTGTRAAGPFAILDSIHSSVDAIVAVDSNVAFPKLNVFWSVNNTTATGDTDDGDIGTSFYQRVGNESSIFLLGSANNDTDEYDEHIITHEFGHYFEDRLARGDSIGGSHGQGDRLEATVAFGEGWGNAFSAISLGDSMYRDSLGASQSSGFSFDIESNSHVNAGWYNEFSVHSIIYDIFDSANDGADTISGGFGPIYTAFMHADYTDSPELTTIFSFVNSLRNNTGVSGAALTSLLSAQSINGTGADGAGETNNGGVTTALPLYQTVTVGGAGVTVCSVDDHGVFNKLGNIAFLRLSIAASQSYTLTMTQSSGLTNRDPDFQILLLGQTIAFAESTAVDTEQLTITLAPGEYAIRAYDFLNATAANSGDSCYTFTVV